MGSHARVCAGARICDAVTAAWGGVCCVGPQLPLDQDQAREREE
jgi:hypothetical protein